MTDLITREDLAEVIRCMECPEVVTKCEVELIGEAILEQAFPPKFVPSVGQVVAVWRDYGQVKFDKFKLMDSTKAPYVCEISDWHNCRALTAEEKGEL